MIRRAVCRVAWRAGATVALVLPLVTAPTGCSLEGPAHPAIGRSLAAAPLVRLGGPRDVAPVLEGKVTLLNFWATWCGPCQRELPGLARLAGRLAAEPRFQLLAVSCGSDDTDQLTRESFAFLATHRLDLDVWAFADPPGRSAFATSYALDALPTTYLIGPDARIRRVWVGYRSRDEADIARAVLELLKPDRLADPPAGPAGAPATPAAR